MLSPGLDGLLVLYCLAPFAKFSRKERYCGTIIAAMKAPEEDSAKHVQFDYCRVTHFRLTYR